MESNGDLVLIANYKAGGFYKKWKKDAIIGIVAVILLFILYSALSIEMVGVTLKLLFVLFFPILILGGIIYSSIFQKRKYINNMIKKVFITDNKVSIKTFKWFGYDSIIISSEKINIEIKEQATDAFFVGKNFFLLKFNQDNQNSFYFIKEFFDDSVGFQDRMI